MLSTEMREIGFRTLWFAEPVNMPRTDFRCAAGGQCRGKDEDLRLPGPHRHEGFNVARVAGIGLLLHDRLRVGGCASMSVSDICRNNEKPPRRPSGAWNIPSGAGRGYVAVTFATSR
jgi:hypothetical protein